MKTVWRSLLVYSSLAFVLRILVSTRFAVSAEEKGAAFNVCIRNNSFQGCCHALGGEYEAEYDEDGNLTGESCTLHSDPMETIEGLLPPQPFTTSIRFTAAPVDVEELT
jgi:hypothetical protein